MGDQKKQQYQLPLLMFIFVFSQYVIPANGWLTFWNPKESSSTQIPSSPDNSAVFETSTLESLKNSKGDELVQTARKRMQLSNSCWQDAYQNLFKGCSQIMSDEEMRSRLAYHLSACFQKETMAPNRFPYCDPKVSTSTCLAKVDQDARKVYLGFLLETNNICHQLQADGFKRQTERLVNDLKKSAEFAEDKLDIIEGKAEELLQNSNNIHDSLASIDLQTQQVAKITRSVEDHVDTVLKHSQAVYNQSKEIAASQIDLAEGQEEMKEKLQKSMEVLDQSYKKVVLEIMRLKKEAAEIEKKISEVGEAMASKMNMLQITADDIQNIAGMSLDKQKQLLDGQSVALDGLQDLTAFQSKALEESKFTFQQFIELKDKQQDELLQRQQQLQQTHDDLVSSSNTILEAQKTFESKQATMFVALDKLYSLHKAMLLESRFIKSFIIYCGVIFFLHFLTSTKETFSVRSRLYLGLLIMVTVEYLVIKFANGVEQQTLLINWVRIGAGISALIQYLYAIVRYKDLELINHHMLRKLADHYNGMQANNELPVDYDSDVDWSTWVDTDLPEDLDIQEDPDYMLPEGVGESSDATNSTSSKYNLRRRLRP